MLLKENFMAKNIPKSARLQFVTVRYFCNIFFTSLIEFLQGKSTEIIGFVWTSVNEIVFVTDNGIELYQVKNDSVLFSKVYTINFKNVFSLKLRFTPRRGCSN